MKFPYAVKYGGVIYPANTEIKEIKPEPLEKPVEEKANAEVKAPAKKKAVKGDK